MVTADALQQFLLDYKRQLKQAADSPQYMPPLTEALFAGYERTGSRLDYETAYFARRKCLAVLGLQSVVEQEEDGCVLPTRLNALTTVIEDICGEMCWALPAHVDSRNDPQWFVTVDLFAAETAQTLAELSVRLESQLPPSVCGLIADEVERRVFTPFLNTPAPYPDWEGSFNNWNAVCAGAIGSAALNLLQNQPDRLNCCLERVCASLPSYIRGFAEDGTCLEGATYYTYGMTYFVNFALELYAFTTGKTDLLCGEWGGFPAGQNGVRANIARFLPKCFFPDGNSVSFADATSLETFRVGQLCALSMRFPGVELPSLHCAAGLHSDPCYRFAALRMDLFCTQQYLNTGLIWQPDAPEETRSVARFDILPAAQWCVGRSASGTGFACKGGDNGGSHNHNDIGHFIYEAGGVMLLTDLGLGEYTRDYYGPRRYEILCAGSQGHSVPIVDGEGQCAGSQYRCDAFDAREDGTVELELHSAYRPSLLKRFVRRFEFNLGNGGLWVRDRLWLSCGSEVLENLITQVQPELTDGGILLRSGLVTMLLRIALPTQADISVQTYCHRNHQGEPEPVYAIQWAVPAVGDTAESCFFICRIE